MNVKDKEAFKVWYLGMNCYEEISRDAWQAACEYKKEAFDAYVRRDEIIKSLQAENKKLREALEHIYETSDDYDSAKYAREALKKDEGA
jgi:hypothetical protein